VGDEHARMQLWSLACKNEAEGGPRILSSGCLTTKRFCNVQNTHLQASEHRAVWIPEFLRNRSGVAQDYRYNIYQVLKIEWVDEDYKFSAGAIIVEEARHH
jgi:hypothetical protein